MRSLCYKLFLSFLALFITNQTFASTTYSYEALHRRIRTHPEEVKAEILLFRKQAIARKDKLSTGKSYLLLGEMYHSRAELLSSAKAYKTSLTIFKQLNNEQFEARANQGIGGMYLAMEDFDKAISFQRKNLAYQLQHGKQTDKADAYFNIASTKACLKESDSAFYYYRVAEAIYQKENDLSSLSRVYLMTGYLYFDTGNHDLALAYEQQALRTSRITKSKLDMQGILFSIGSIYRAKGDNDSSRIYFKRALDLSDEVKNVDTEHEICKNLSEIYEKQDSLKLSHYYLLRCKKLKDSLLTPQKIHSINAIDFSENRKQSNTQLLWWIIFLFFLFLLCALYLFRRRGPKLPAGTAGQHHTELEAKLNHQQKELMTQTIRLQQQGELIERTKNELRGLELNDHNRARVRTLLSELKSTQQSSNWSEFERHFNDVHLDFYKKLMTDYPQLTVNERRLCGFISLNLSNKEISEITRKSVRSIEVAKYRLGQKLEVPKEGSIKEILSKYL